MEPVINKPKSIYPNTFWVVLIVGIVISGSYLGYFYLNLKAEQLLSDFNHSLSLHDYQNVMVLYERAPTDGLKQQMDETIESTFKGYRSELIKNIDEAHLEPFNQMSLMKSRLTPVIARELNDLLSQFEERSLDHQEIINYAKNLQKVGFDLQENSLFQTQLTQSLNAYYTDLSHQGLSLVKSKHYQEAVTLYEEGVLYFPDDSSFQQKLAQARTYAKQLVELVPYDGPIEHVFFHPLIAYPELAFNGNQAVGYNDYFVTVSEFNKILDSLYDKNFILIDINSMVEEQLIDGKEGLARRQLMLPPNKKPLILSIDDVNYYEYMRKNGNIYRLILDEQGNVATYSITPQGEERIAYDNEIIPILDRFVERHPDFSLLGVKGTIALTGYEGILGYRTDEVNSPRYAEDKEKVLKVIARLKETGWNFASHSYGHPDMRKISYEHAVRDTNQWLNEVEPLIGETKIFIYPYGSSLQPNDPKFKYLYDHGFRVFNGVGPTSYINYTKQFVLQDRRHVDGIAFHFQRNLNLDLYDAKEIIDPVRPDRY